MNSKKKIKHIFGYSLRINIEFYSISKLNNCKPLVNMSKEESNHPTLENDVKINLPLDRQLLIHDIVGCKQGIHNNIHVKSKNEDILIQSRVDNVSGNNDLKVFKNNILIQHLVNGVQMNVKQSEDQNQPTQQNQTQNQQNSSQKSENTKL